MTPEEIRGWVQAVGVGLMAVAQIAFGSWVLKLMNERAEHFRRQSAPAMQTALEKTTAAAEKAYREVNVVIERVRDLERALLTAGLEVPPLDSDTAVKYPRLRPEARPPHARHIPQFRLPPTATEELVESTASLLTVSGMPNLGDELVRSLRPPKGERSYVMHDKASGQIITNFRDP